MKAPVYGLAAVRTLGIFSQRLCPLVILIHINGLTIEMWLNKIQHRLYCQSSIWSMSHCNLPGLTSLVDSVTQCCVVLFALTAVYSSLTATPETGRLSLHLSA